MPNLTILDPTTPVKWIVYIAGSLYKARDNTIGQTAFSGSNLKTDIWDNIKSNPVTRNRIHFMNNSSTYDIPSGSTLDVPSNAQDYYVSGESMHGVRLRPLGNDICFQCTNLRRAKFDNFGFYVDQGAAYTTDIWRLEASSGGCESVEISNLKMRHDDGTSTLFQEGRNLVLLFRGTDPNISWLNMHDCHMFGGDSAINITSISPTGAPWINEITFTRVHGTHSPHYFLSQLPTIGSAKRWRFRDCSFQTTGDTLTTIAMFRLFTDAPHRGFLLDGCMMWDPADTLDKFLNINSTDVRMALVNCEPIGDAFMGGTSWDAVNGKWNSGVHITRQSELSVKKGVDSVADGGTVTHGMVDYIAAGSTAAVAPKLVRVQATVAGEFASVTAITTTTFTVAIKKADGTAGTTQDIYWEAIEYV